MSTYTNTTAASPPPLSHSPDNFSTSPSKSPLSPISPVYTTTSSDLATSPSRQTARTSSLGNFFSRSRSKSPAPIRIKPPNRSVTINNPTSHHSTTSPTSILPAPPMSPHSPMQQMHTYPPSPQRYENQKPPHSPARSFSESHASPTSPNRPTNISYSPHGSYTSTGKQEKRHSTSRGQGMSHCGRHTNDWLFGNFSVRDTVSRGFEKVSSKRDSTGGESGHGSDHD